MKCSSEIRMTAIQMAAVFLGVITQFLKTCLVKWFWKLFGHYERLKSVEISVHSSLKYLWPGAALGSIWCSCDKDPEPHIDLIRSIAQTATGYGFAMLQSWSPIGHQLPRGKICTMRFLKSSIMHMKFVTKHSNRWGGYSHSFGIVAVL